MRSTSYGSVLDAFPKISRLAKSQLELIPNDTPSECDIAKAQMLVLGAGTWLISMDICSRAFYGHLYTNSYV